MNHPTLISAENLRVTGDGGNDIIAVEDLRVSSGFTAITGPSGSGKTTLLNALCGLRNVTEGVIQHYDPEGNVVFRHSKEQFSERFKSSVFIDTSHDKVVNRYRSVNTGYIPQSPYLDAQLTPTQQLRTNHVIRGNQIDEPYLKFLTTTLDLVEIFKPQSPQRRKSNPFVELLEILGVSGPRERLCGVLSGGEKQRLSAIIALANKPAIVFADEPTSALDTKHKLPLYELLRHSVDEGGKSVLVVSHDKNIEDFADNIVRVEDGHVIDAQNNITRY